MLSNIGAIYFNQGSYERALDYYLRSLVLAESAQDTLRILTVLTNIGAVYTEIPGSQTLALDYANRAMKLSLLEDDNNAIATNALNIAELYLSEKDYPNAIEYYMLSADKGEADVRLMGLIGLAKAKAAIKNFDEALKLLDEAEEIASSLGMKQALANAIETRAALYNSQMAFQAAIPEFRKALRISKELKYLNVIKGCYSGFKASFANLKQYDSAFKYQSLYAVIDDSIYTLETNRRLNNQLFGFEIEKKQTEIDLLKKDQALQALSIKKQRL